MGKWRHWLVIMGIAATFLWIKTSNPSLNIGFQNLSSDAFQKISPRENTPQPVKILYIDNESLKRIGPWPWSRTVIAQIADKLNKSRVAAYAFNTVFSEPDPLSAKYISRIWSGNIELQKALSKIQDGDAALARALFGGNSIIAFHLNNNNNGEKSPLLLAEFAHQLNIDSDIKTAIESISNYYGSITNIPEIEGTDKEHTNIKGNGAISSIADKDGIIRRSAMLVKLNDVLFPSLISEALRVGQGQSNIIISSNKAQISGDIVHILKIGNARIPVDEHGNLWMHFSTPKSERNIPVWKFMEDDFDTASFTGNVVFIGFSAESLQDSKATPLGFMNSTEIQAQAIEQILNSHYISKPDWIFWYEIAFMLLICVVTPLVIFNTSAMISLIVTGATTGLIFFASWLLFVDKNIFTDPLIIIASLASVSFYAYLIKTIKYIHDKLSTRQAFRQYISPSLIPRLIAEKQTIRMNGEHKGISVLFCDICDFSNVLERYDAAGITSFMNRFFNPMTEIILDHKGTIDKYIGDSIMAFWNAPLNDEDHTRNSCITALNLLKCVKGINTKNVLSDQTYKPIEIGIGINTGVASVGNMGSSHKFNYSALGNEVDLAWNLKELSKKYGARIIIGENTQCNIEDFACLELDFINVKGNQKPVRIFALLGDSTVAGTSTFKDLSICFQEMLYYYRLGNFSDAAKAINTIKLMEIGNVPLNLEKTAALFISRISQLSANPPRNWEGVFE